MKSPDAAANTVRKRKAAVMLQWPFTYLSKKGREHFITVIVAAQLKIIIKKKDTLKQRRFSVRIRIKLHSGRDNGWRDSAILKPLSVQTKPVCRHAAGGLHGPEQDEEGEPGLRDIVLPFPQPL